MSAMADDIHEPTASKRPLKGITLSFILVPLVIGLVTGVLAGFGGIVDVQTAVGTGVVAALLFGIPYAAILAFYKPGDIGVSLEDDAGVSFEAPE